MSDKVATWVAFTLFAIAGGSVLYHYGSELLTPKNRFYRARDVYLGDRHYNADVVVSPDKEHAEIYPSDKDEGIPLTWKRKHPFDSSGHEIESETRADCSEGVCIGVDSRGREWEVHFDTNGE